jgi:biopolymer transport protein ExbD
MSLVVPRRRRNEINVIPLVDVMVVLVFFLLLAGRFEESRTLSIIPPAADAGGMSSTAASMVIGVDREGKIYLEGKEINQTDLNKALADKAKLSPEAEVLIVADERSLTGTAVGVLDSVVKVGLRPRLLTRPSK